MVDAVVVEVPDTASGAGASRSATSWGAILGGAFVIAAVSLLLLAIGAGFSLSTISPWPNSGASATTFTIIAAVWLLVVQWLSSGIGGYIAGRLRTQWTGIHSDEVYFRDTAHGVLAWAVATVISASVLAGVASLVLTGAVSGTTSGTSQGAAQNPATTPSAYLVDTLFRTDRPDAAAGQDPRPEVTRIIASGLRPGSDVSATDKTYLAKLVAAHTGISQDEAQKRVDDAITNARQAADTARKATRNTAVFIGLSMLVGAFIAGVAAKVGGHHRDTLIAR
jgi:hypothetical protein